MKFSRQTFVSILSMHQPNLDKKSINPIFASVNLITTENELRMISTDGQRFLQHSISGEFEQGSIFINGITLYEIIKKSKSDFFYIKETFDSYKISVDNAEFKFSKHTNPEFPEWPNKYDHVFTIKASLLAEGLKTVRWASSNEDTRPTLNGICFDFNNNILNLCATDSLKLAVFKIFDNYNFSGRWILGKKSISELIKILEDFGAPDVEISLGSNFQIVAKKNNSTIIWKSLCINGTFPNYEKLILEKKVFNSSFIGDAKNILESLDRIMIVSNQHQHTIILKFLEDEPSKISAENSISEGEDMLPGTYTGKKMKILFDGRFLQEMLNNIEGDIIFEITDPMAPITVKKLENNGSLFVVAPIRPDM